MTSVTLTAGFLTLAGCSQAPPPAPPDTRAQDADAIKQADVAAAAAANTREADKLMAFYTDDTTILPPNAPTMTGRDNARNFFAELMKPADFSIAWQPTKVEAARSGDLGYSIGTYHMMFTTPDGTMIMDDGKYSTVWKKQADGSWKIAIDAFNSNTPLPAAPKGKK